MKKFSQITNSIDLLFLLNKLFPKFDNRVVPIDKLTKLEPKMKQNIIVNFQKSNQAGNHWVLITCIEPRWVEYMDSFGLPPPEEILKFMRRYDADDMISTTKQFQDVRDEYCGWACLYYSYLRITKKMLPWTGNDSMNKKAVLAFGRRLTKRFLKA